MKSFRTILSAGFLASALVLAGCGGGSESTMDDDMSDAMDMAKTNAMNAITMANTAANGLTNESDEATVMAARMAISAAVTAIGALDADDRAEYTVMLATAENTVSHHEGRIAEAKRQMTEDERIANEAEMAATVAMAAKLYAGISAPMGTAGSPAAGDRIAAYNSGDTAIEVSAGVPADSPAAVTLSEDKKTVVDAIAGWAGKRYADPDGGDMYEAMVYSNVGEPTPGKKYGGAAAGDEFEYALESGMRTVDTSTAAEQAKVDSPSFDQSAGVKTFELPDNHKAVMIPGSNHGVSGTYSCTPTGSTICASRVAADGFELGTVASATDSTFSVGTSGWTFKPTDPNARVMSVDDANYASYGWWIRKSADDKTYTASAFADIKGTVAAGSNPATLQGTATYMGGAAGKYALSSSTGGMNDAGHFMADAKLEANFSDNTIMGTIDNFTGADGMARDWSVELKEAAVSETGGISRTETNDTVWTIGEDAANASGEWMGTLYDNGDDGVPKVATGTFHSMYGTDGAMVGAFGANVDN